jgi:Protein of unknown function (DUF3593)
MTVTANIILVAAFLLVVSTISIQAFQVPYCPRVVSTTRTITIRKTPSSVTSFTLSQQQPHLLHMMDPSSIIMDAAATAVSSATNVGIMSSGIDSMPSLLTSFVDQGTNLAGIFFQASLLPYLLFLYFLSYRANRISSWSNFGFQFILLFVMSTIPSGIWAKSIYGTKLANVDWLHGGAESLLTLANIFIVCIYYSKKLVVFLVLLS